MCLQQILRKTTSFYPVLSQFSIFYLLAFLITTLITFCEYLCVDKINNTLINIMFNGLSYQN